MKQIQNLKVIIIKKGDFVFVSIVMVINYSSNIYMTLFCYFG